MATNKIRPLKLNLMSALSKNDEYRLRRDTLIECTHSLNSRMGWILVRGMEVLAAATSRAAATVRVTLVNRGNLPLGMM